MSHPVIPASAQILVIGGGPAGSYTASVLAREGFNVVLLEASKFPRYHIGESMLPSVRRFLKFIDLEETVKAYGFTPKPGAAVKLNQYKREGYTDFIAADPENGSWNVVRSEFDNLLLQHASSSGAAVFHETKVTELHFAQSPGSSDSDSDSDSGSKRPIAASWQSPSGTGRISFDYLVDASGRNGLMSVKYLKNRRFNRSLKNVACWGYWVGTDRYMPGTPRENAIWVEALNDELGWTWFIPLHDGSTSVGVVMNKDISAEKRRNYGEGDYAQKLHNFYLDELTRTPGVMKLIGKGTLRHDGTDEGVKTASDFSYAATTYSGDHFRIVGDAGAFIDPFFSSGVHLAMTGALSAAVTIASSIRGTVDEARACRWHDSKIGTAYTRFLLVVLGTYKQIRNQSEPIMSDIDEDNFDRAFDLIRPVIQGTADVGKVVTEDELQKTMDFCTRIFTPTDPKMVRSVGERLNPEVLSPSGSVLSDEQINGMVAADDWEARAVLHKANARKPLGEMNDPTHTFATEVHCGMKARVERGGLGLIAA